MWDMRGVPPSGWMSVRQLARSGDLDGLLSPAQREGRAMWGLTPTMTVCPLTTASVRWSPRVKATTSVLPRTGRVGRASFHQEGDRVLGGARCPGSGGPLRAPWGLGWD